MTAAEPTIYMQIARILADLPAIGKNQRNQQQGFSFRGIDDVLDALNPLLAKHGVFFVPTVLERQESARQTRNGGTMWVVDLHVQYTFYGPSGDSIVASGWGEGTDSGDKATQKAMTGAMKYVLFQVFAIATNEQAESDSDHTTPEPTTRPTRVVPSPARTDVEHPAADDGAGVQTPPQSTPAPISLNRVQQLQAKLSAMIADGVKGVADERTKAGLPKLDENCTLAELDLWADLLNRMDPNLERMIV